MKNNPARIVIIGGGIAGIQIATGLARAVGSDKAASITLVDRSLSHVWKPMLHTFAAGTASADRQKIDFFDQAKRSGFHFQPGALASVDRSAGRIRLVVEHTVDRETAELGYDILVIATGSRANDFGTPGVEEHCLTIDDPKEAENFHRHLGRHVIRTSRGRDVLDIAIVGGGATGVELAGELKRAIDLMAGYGSPSLPQRLRLALIESGPRLLPAFPERISRAAAATLSGLGVEVQTGKRVAGADAGAFILSDGTRIDAALKVWAAGVKAPAVLAGIAGLEVSKSGQLVVEPDLRTTRDPAIFALGDCASLIDEKTGKPVPATAQAALQQAQHLTRDLAKGLSGGRLHDVSTPFRYVEKGAIVSLADYNGWGTLGRYTFGGGRLRGISARVAHALLYRQHQLGLLGPWRGPLSWFADSIDRIVAPPVRLD